MRLIIISLFLFMMPLENTPSQLTITYDDDVLGLVHRQQFALPYINSLFINESKLESLFKEINEKIYKQPVDAKISEEGEIIPDEVGYVLDEQKLNKEFRTFFYEGKPLTVEVSTKKLYSRVTSEVLADIYVDKVGSFVTYYQENNLERSHNIALSTKAINNTVLFPGEEFSFNKIVGERTKARGYQKAPVIVKGEFSEDIGGGICQVSSTLFNAVLIEGLQIVERYSHSRSVPYVPPGKDAAVSWWGPDFVFKNQLNEPILIQAKSKNGKVEIDIYSAEKS